MSKYVQKLDPDGTGTVDYDEFMLVMEEVRFRPQARSQTVEEESSYVLLSLPPQSQNYIQTVVPFAA